MTASPDRWSTPVARVRIPASLLPTHTGLCRPSHPIAGCPTCRWLLRDRARAYRTTPEGRAAANAAARAAYRAHSTSKSRQANKAAAYAAYRARSAPEADADFARLRPAGKPCPGCGEFLPAKAFKRNWTELDGRQRRCDRNGCRMRHQRLKRDAKLRAYWAARGINPAICIYCETNLATDIEHVMPKALGGSDDFSNLAPACPGCNRGVGGKFDIQPLVWLRANHPHRVEPILALFPHIKETP